MWMLNLCAFSLITERLGVNKFVLKVQGDLLVGVMLTANRPQNPQGPIYFSLSYFSSYSGTQVPVVMKLCYPLGQPFSA